MMWDVVRLLSSGKELSAGVACLHRGTICFKGHMQIRGHKTEMTT